MTSPAASEPFVFAPTGSNPIDALGHDAIARGAFGKDSNVEQARQEISQIVREVANASHQERTRIDYLRFLADRILRAMAGHGVVIWTRSSVEEPLSADPSGVQYIPEHRLGRTTDLALVDEAVPVHQCLLLDVAGQGQPVVVPPTPGANQVDVPANPLPYPAAIVPYRIDPSSPMPEGLIEVFLEDGGTVASHRGCLRFLAQMADLAGEFLRAQRLRHLTQMLDATQCVDHIVDRLHRMTSSTSIEAAWVDSAAELLQRPRVALCRVDGIQPKVVAVSNVPQIDQHSDAAKTIREAASRLLTRQRGMWMADASNADDAGQAEDQAICVPESVVAIHPDSRWRLITFRNAMPDPAGDEADVSQMTLHRIMLGAESAWTAARRVESIPGGRWWARFLIDDNATAIDNEHHSSATRLLQNQTRATRSLRRRFAALAGAAIAFGILLCLPLPRLVPIDGVIRPLELDNYHAASDAVVDQLHVRHGQTVRRGDMLATLVSLDLQEQRTSLLGRRAVLLRRREQVNQTLMSRETSPAERDSAERGREVEEEIDAIDRQLEIVDASMQRLQLRATRDGRVDAWRLTERLSDRPLRRGDAVLTVIAKDTSWVVDACVPQTRMQTVDNAMRSQTLHASAGTTWSSEMDLTAEPIQFGPVTPDPVDGTPTVILRLQLDSPPKLGGKSLAEMPARVTLDCGQTTVGWFLVQDMVHWCQTQWGAYW